MSFSTAISGVNAATSELNVISNNIANASTVGFKTSSAEFAEVFASSLLGSGAAATGQGVVLSEIRTDFSQGNIEFTSNGLDMAISGNGFFVVTGDEGGREFTRAGGFRVDREGFLVNAASQRLQGFQANGDGEITGAMDDLFIDTTLIAPEETKGVTLISNIDSRDIAPTAATPFDPEDPLTYNSATSTTIYDSLGNSHVQNVYFRKDLTPVGTATNSYSIYVTIDSEQLYTNAATPNGTIGFDRSGQIIPNTIDPLLNTSVDTLTYAPKDINGVVNGAVGGDNGILTVDLISTTQFGTDFAVSSILQDGFGAGQLIAFEIDETGLAFARFTNGQSKAIGQVALANFRNNNGLQPVGETNFSETYLSGEPTIGEPGGGGRGSIEASAIESANVDLTAELVSLIIAQRNFQANAQVIQANDQLTTAVINLR